MNWIRFSGKEKAWGVEISEDKSKVATFFMEYYRVEISAQEILSTFIAYKAGLEIPRKKITCHVIEECGKETCQTRKVIPIVNKSRALCFDCLRGHKNIENEAEAMFTEEEVDFLLENLV